VIIGNTNCSNKSVDFFIPKDNDNILYLAFIVRVIQLRNLSRGWYLPSKSSILDPIK
jgi:ribosomal protein S2